MKLKNVQQQSYSDKLHWQTTIPVAEDTENYNFIANCYPNAFKQLWTNILPISKLNSRQQHILFCPNKS